MIIMPDDTCYELKLSTQDIDPHRDIHFANLTTEEYRAQSDADRRHELRESILAVAALVGVDFNALLPAPSISDWSHSDDRVKAAQEKRERKQAKRLLQHQLK